MAVLHYVTEVRDLPRPSRSPGATPPSSVGPRPPAAPGAVGLQLHTNALGDAGRRGQLGAEGGSRAVPEVAQGYSACSPTFTSSPPLKKSGAQKPPVNSLGGPSASPCLRGGAGGQGRDQSSSGRRVRASLMRCFYFPRPNPATSVHGVHGERQHGPGLHGLPDRGRHQQDLRLGEALGSRAGAPSVGAWLQDPSYVVLCPQEAAWKVTDECIQIMGGMGFMKVQAGSVPRVAPAGTAGWVGAPRQRRVFCLPLAGAWGGACSPRSSHLPDLRGDERHPPAVCGSAGLYGKRERGGGAVRRRGCPERWALSPPRTKERNSLDSAML